MADSTTPEAPARDLESNLHPNRITFNPSPEVQIEFRTLSIHVSESRQNETAPDLKHPPSPYRDTADSSYFANLPWHDLSSD